MARSQLGHLGAHALSKKALQFRLNGAVFGADDVVGRFGFPCCSENRLTEQVRQGSHLGGPDHFLFRIGKVAGKVRGSRLTQEQSAVGRFDMLKYGRRLAAYPVEDLWIILNPHRRQLRYVASFPTSMTNMAARSPDLADQLRQDCGLEFVHSRASLQEESRRS